jgi:outer membrane biogenesis lipoprotein LolB
MVVVLLLAILWLQGCTEKAPVAANNFVGKWQSSKLTTPIYLYASGEWEVKTAEGAILQYGVWTFKNQRITWSVKIDAQISHDSNAILSVTPDAFQLRENDGSVTTFNRIS